MQKESDGFGRRSVSFVSMVDLDIILRVIGNESDAASRVTEQLDPRSCLPSRLGLAYSLLLLSIAKGVMLYRSTGSSV